ncbi:hypothetical protein OIU34_26830 [Pararhizobium sp. BT-229]|uniref:hypothetical protein n=1 Tax=Pararhizobium sp. BT-229 TaxID=2986923 RepID=UPI0021F73F6F|nr:hypothetical protein [Pararhizobium sp. BT-229]MCV9965498.1 hypothetical protein [Pararhizobium sp. BT-229]
MTRIQPRDERQIRMMTSLSEYLGKPVATFLASSPFKFWPYERSVEEGLPEHPVDYVFSEHGLSLTCDSDEKIESIFIQANSFDHSLSDIQFALRRHEVIKLLGVASKSGGPMRHPILDQYGVWDRFDRADYSIHIEYQPDEDRIKLITLMRADVVP